MNRVFRWSPLGLVALSSLAWPNGGPDAWNEPAGVGDGAPIALSTVQLVSEDLVLTVGADPDAYDVEARYTLDNPGAPTTVAYGVPITWGVYGEFEADDAALKKAASGISLELGGAKLGCTLEKHPPKQVELPEGLWIDPVSLGAWCVARLTIPTGDAKLVLRYRASAAFVDSSTSKSALPSWAHRDIVYPLFPAAGWTGKPKLTARLELGRWAQQAQIVQPSGFTRDGTAWVYTAPAADLGGMLAIVARIDVATEKLHAFIATYNADASPYRLKLAAKASSTLTGGTYDAKNLVDGVAATAWCEGVDGDGVGQWVEVSAAPGTTVEAQCGFEGLAFVPGYAKSQTIYENNNRVRSVRIGPCGTDGGEVVDLAPGDRFDRSAQFVGMAFMSGRTDGLTALGAPFANDAAKLCFRVTIASVDPGAKYHDTCVSELAALVNCG